MNSTLAAAIAPFQDEYRQWLSAHPEEHRRARMQNVIMAAQGSLCQYISAHFSCYQQLQAEQRLLSWIGEHRPEVLESIFPSFKEAIIAAGILPMLDWPRVETHDTFRFPEDFESLSTEEANG